jgi:hypothetical protein
MIYKGLIKAFVICLFLISPCFAAINLTENQKQPEAIRFSVEEVSKMPGLVSTQAKFFKLIIEYNPDLLVNNPDNLILDRVRVRSMQVGEKKRKPVSLLDDFKFNFQKAYDLEDGFRKLEYISNAQLIMKASQLKFKLDVSDILDERFLDSSNFITKISIKKDFAPLDLKFNNVKIKQTVIGFSKDNKKSLKSKLRSGKLYIIAQVITKQDLTQIITKDLFSFESKTKKLISPKFRSSETKDSISLSIDNSKYDISVFFLGGSLYEIYIPIDLVTKMSIRDVDSKKIEAFDNLMIPVQVKGRTADSLDITISGILKQKFTVIKNEQN